MGGFLVGVGVFWLLVWIAVLIISLCTKEETGVGLGIFGVGISLIYLSAVGVGLAVG